MTSSTSPASSNEIDESTVEQYLRDNPDFFSGRDELLAAMIIPHESGSAISLLERQVNLLREKSDERQRNIDNFIANARANDELFEKVRSIILDLLKTSSLESLTDVVEQQLKRDFAASVCRLVFICETDAGNDVPVLSHEAGKESLGEMFEHKRSFCCTLDSQQAALLFPESEEEIVSAAIIPVHLHPENGASSVPGMPLLMIGSDTEHQFHSNLDTLFLDFIGEVLATHLANIFTR